jgi:hypothetical protein
MFRERVAVHGRPARERVALDPPLVTETAKMVGPAVAPSCRDSHPSLYAYLLPAETSLPPTHAPFILTPSS